MPDSRRLTADTRLRILDLYCCQGGAGMGYSWAGFDVVGVDIASQPRYPFEFIQMDAIEAVEHLLWRGLNAPSGRYLLCDFDAIHASPPCQRYSATQRINGNDHPDLIHPTRTALEATGLPYVIENVPDARDELRDPFMLCGAMFDGLRVYRHRLFETNWRMPVLPVHPPHVAPQVKMGRAPKPGEWVQAVGNFSGVDEAREAMCIDWMNRDGLRECIPPDYTAWVGSLLDAHLQRVQGVQGAA